MKIKLNLAAWLLIAITVISLFLGSVHFSVHANVKNYQIYMPIIMFSARWSSNECENNLQELDFADIMRNHPDQKRPSLTCDPILTRVAQEKALDMAVRNYFGHVNPDGYGPNYLVWHAGYHHPYSQDPTANNIESIAAGSGHSTAESVWNYLMSGNSTHANHLLGLDSFFAEQVDLGVGYVFVPGSRLGHYWVIITARR